MTALLISHTADLNGAERSLLDLAIGLRKQKMDCFVLCPMEGPLTSQLRQERVPTYIFNLPRPRRHPLALFKFLLLWILTVLRLVSFLRRKNIRVVYNNTIDGLYGPFSAKLAGIPCVWHIREIKPNYNQLRKLFTWLLVRLPTVAVFNSNATMRAYSHQKSPNWKVIYNGVEIPSNPPDFEPNKPTITVGFAGQMVPLKAPDRFIRAFEIARKSYPLLEGVMAGDGPLLDELSLLLADRELQGSIRMTGHIKEMSDFYKQIDVLVLTSKKESFGRVLIEAMSYGRPVIAANVDGIPEVVVHGKTGFLVDANDIEAYAEKIVLLATDKNLRNQIGRSAYERVNSYFSIARYQEQMIEILTQVGQLKK